MLSNLHFKENITLCDGRLSDIMEVAIFDKTEKFVAGEWYIHGDKKPSLKR